MKHIHMLLGGMTGAFLDRLPPSNTGMYQLKAMLAPQLVTVWTWGDYQRAVADIKLNWKEGNKVILIGYSGGGSRGTYACNLLNPLPVDLFVAYDPSPAGQMEPILNNVRHAVCYHNTKPGMSWPGVGKLGGGRIVTNEVRPLPVIDTIDISQFHLAVQFNKLLHQHTIDLIRSL